MSREAIHMTMLGTRRRLAVVAVISFIAAVPAPASAEHASSTLLLNGNGGEGTWLSVGAGGLTMQEPDWLSTPRNPGPDGTMTGIVVAAGGANRLLYGHVVLNAPGRGNRGLVVPLTGHQVHLRAGTYRVALIGSGPQSASIRLPQSRRDITLRTTAGDQVLQQEQVQEFGTVLNSWATTVATTAYGTYLAWAGGGGTATQAEYSDVCVSRSAQGCEGPPFSRSAGSEADDQLLLTPGSAGGSMWSVKIFHPGGQLLQGKHRFAGDNVGLGLTTVGYGWYGVEFRS